MRVQPGKLLDMLTPKSELGYNAAGDLIQIKKHVSGYTFLRVISDIEILDNVVAKWVEYGDWNVV